MSSPRKANRENVFQACDQLYADGHRITIPLVRDALGGGSQNSLHRYVREWEGQQRERFLALQRQSLAPPSTDIPEALWRALVPIWEQLVDAAKAAGRAEVESGRKQQRPSKRRAQSKS